MAGWLLGIIKAMNEFGGLKTAYRLRLVTFLLSDHQIRLQNLICSLISHHGCLISSYSSLDFDIYSKNRIDCF